MASPPVCVSTAPSALRRCMRRFHVTPRRRARPLCCRCVHQLQFGPGAPQSLAVPPLSSYFTAAQRMGLRQSIALGQDQSRIDLQYVLPVSMMDQPSSDTSNLSSFSTSTTSLRAAQSRPWAAQLARGHLRTVRFLHMRTSRKMCTVSAMNGAAADGFLAVVQFLHIYRFDDDTPETMN